MLDLLLNQPLRFLELFYSGEDPRNDRFFQETLDLTNIATTNQAFVLVHGFIGWGREEPVIPTPLPDDLKYWGGFTHDIQQYLRQHDLDVYTASVGPISSVWDRACELYGQLAGRTVDYGAVHAAKMGHGRFGKVYSQPLISGWDETNPNPDKKINLIGHSTGGLDTRLLIHLLEHGCPEEEEHHRQHGTLNEMSPLFRTDQPKRWVRSLTTLSTLHDGTTLLAAAGRTDEHGAQHPQAFFALLAALVDFSPMPPFSYYDADMQHWGNLWDEKVSPDEIASIVLKRFALSFDDSIVPCPWDPHEASWEKIFTTRDLALFDLTPAGCQALNEWVLESPEVYYLSYTTRATLEDGRNGNRHKGIPSTCQIFNMELPPLLARQVIRQMGIADNNLGPGGKPTVNFTRLMGGYVDANGRIPIDSSWWPNDGIVNSRSMDGPKSGRKTSNIVPYDHARGDKLPKGVWNHMGTLYGWDHFDITGLLDVEKEHWINQADTYLESLVRFGFQNLVVPVYAWLQGGGRLEPYRHHVQGFYNRLVTTLLTRLD